MSENSKFLQTTDPTLCSTIEILRQFPVHGARMGQVYTQEEIQFIVTLTVVMVVVVAIAVTLSIIVSQRRNKQLDCEHLTGTESAYTLTTDIQDIWSVQGHYNPIVT